MQTRGDNNGRIVSVISRKYALARCAREALYEIRIAKALRCREGKAFTLTY